MPAYLPSSPTFAVALSATLLVILVLGHAATRWLPLFWGRVCGWSSVIVTTACAERILAGEPAGFRMVALITIALLGMKVLVVVEERGRGLRALTFGEWVAFSATWLGMQPNLFATESRDPLGGGVALLRRGIANLILGAVFVVIARVTWTTFHSRFLASVFLLPGLSLLVHFGLCNLMAGGWRLRGVACDALFRAPLLSQNLGELWSRRWNVAFSEMTAIAAYRPLSARVGRAPALIASFALSGLLHEMAISVPVRAGFGLPLLYFLLHGVLVLAERALARAGHPLSGWRGRAWTFFWIVLPLPLLFHRAFLAGVAWPLIGIPDAD